MVTSDEEKIRLTDTVAFCEAGYAGALPHSTIDGILRSVREQLMLVSRWDDGGWLWSDWDTWQGLMDRVNRLDRLLIVADNPGAIAAGVLTAEGDVVLVSPTMAGIEAGVESVREDLGSAWDALKRFNLWLAANKKTVLLVAGLGAGLYLFLVLRSLRP